MPSRGRRTAAAILAATLGGCVYPATEPTGVELSWRFVEHNEVDGEDTALVRSCAGALAEQVAIHVQDEDAPARQGVFRFDCTQGYQTVADVQTEASDAFIRLDPGDYTVSVHAVDDAANAQNDEALEVRDVLVEERIITISTWALTRAPTDWSVELRGAATCESVFLALYYASPERDLAEYTPDAEQSLPLYRAALASDRGLPAGGVATPCSAELEGTHVFEGLDRGEYRLDVVVDGEVICAPLVDLRSSGSVSSVIDLANGTCQG